MDCGERIASGCSSLDDLLGGGLERGTVSQVYGPPAAGKTNLALVFSINTVASGGRVYYIDTEGFSPDRFDQLIGTHGSGVDSDRFLRTQAHDFEEQREAVKDAERVASKMDLIVLDSATGFYRLERADDAREGDALRAVTKQVTHLLSLARKNDLAVLITNQVYTDPEAEQARPLGGHTLAHWSGTILRLQRFRGDRRRASLEKHRSQPTGDHAAFKITESGIESETVHR